jgi:hypothetical protein
MSKEARGVAIATLAAILSVGGVESLLADSVPARRGGACESVRCEGTSMCTSENAEGLTCTLNAASCKTIACEPN